MKKVINEFSMKDSGHAKLMQNPTQNETKEYNFLKEKFIQILEKRKYSLEVDKIDNRRTIEVVKANKMTMHQLIDLIESNKIMEELLQKKRS